MGSKASLLKQDLGDLLRREIDGRDRFVDLFSGSGAVSHHVAERYKIPTLSFDIQNSCKYLSASIIERTENSHDSFPVREWVKKSSELSDGNELSEKARHSSRRVSMTSVEESRRLCRGRSSAEQGFVFKDYGGHYFSPLQAIELDSLYTMLPIGKSDRSLAMAALLMTASKCAAAPGHTAQPFQPKKSLIPYIQNSWEKSVMFECQRYLDTLSMRHALVLGEARVGDAYEVASELQKGDLVFCDPPYSDVQYSRFYHVLEGISVGGWPSVSGSGRSPEIALRRRSKFSMRSASNSAMSDLLTRLRESQCRVVVTFPDADASNGMSGKDIIDMARSDWRVKTHSIASSHSTLGGSSGEGGRGGRKSLNELVLVLSPK